MFNFLVKLLLFALLCLQRFSGRTADGPAVAWALGALGLGLLPILFGTHFRAFFKAAWALILSLLMMFFAPLRFFFPLFIGDFMPPFLRPEERGSESGLGDLLGTFSPLLLLIPFFRDFSLFNTLLSLMALLSAYAGNELELRRNRLHRQRDDFEEDLLRLEESLQSRRDQEEKNRHITRLDERNRISRSLHDVTGHTLSSALVQLDAIKVLNRDENLKEPLNKLHETLDWGMTGIREAVHDLHKDALDLRTELETILDRAEGFSHTLNCPDTSELPFQMRLDILSIAREAVTNAMKHSDGNRIEISLSVQRQLAALNVFDNGSQSEEGEISFTGSGMGLRGMKTIMERNEGLLNIHRKPGQGFTVHAVFFRKDGTQERPGQRDDKAGQEKDGPKKENL